MVAVGFVDSWEVTAPGICEIIAAVAAGPIEVIAAETCEIIAVLASDFTDGWEVTVLVTSVMTTDDAATLMEDDDKTARVDMVCDLPEAILVRVNTRGAEVLANFALILMDVFYRLRFVTSVLNDAI